MDINMALNNALHFLNKFDSNITRWYSEAEDAISKIKDIDDDGSAETLDDYRDIWKRFEKKNDDGTERHNTIYREMDDLDFDFDNFNESMGIIIKNKHNPIVINHLRLFRNFEHTYSDLSHDIKKDYEDWEDDIDIANRDRDFQKVLAYRRIFGPVQKIMDYLDKVIEKLKSVIGEK